MTIRELSPTAQALVVGMILAFVPAFGLGAATGSAIQTAKDDGRSPAVEVNGQVYGHCDRIDTHTWRCTP